jgi:hydrogenase-4 component B
MFLHSGHPALASLALLAGLYHTMNHAVFKALLFLGAGAVVQQTHTRNMEEMGGLARRMGWTSAFFLVGAAAISALPPLNGFVSEWLTYQSLLQGFGTTESLIRLMFPIGGALLALTGALAAACFVKAFGITFLAQPRGEGARRAREASCSMLLGQGLLTAACVFLGLCPILFLKVLDPVTQQLTGLQLSGQLSVAGRPGALDGASPQRGTISTSRRRAPGFVFAARAAWRCGLCLRAPGQGRSIGPTWACGQQGADAANGIHRHGLLQAAADDFQGALPPAARGAARI